MKRIFILASITLCSLLTMAQVQVWKGGAIDFQAETTQIDSITFDAALPTPDPTPDPEPIGITVCCNKPSAWSSVYLWAWYDNPATNIFEAWPGKQLTPDANGVYRYTFDESIKTINVIFSNNGTPQTADITGVTRNTCFELQNDGNYSISIGVD